MVTSGYRGVEEKAEETADFTNNNVWLKVEGNFGW